jgi:hypothetical protein
MSKDPDLETLRRDRKEAFEQLMREAERANEAGE